MAIDRVGFSLLSIAIVSGTAFSGSALAAPAADVHLTAPNAEVYYTAPITDVTHTTPSPEESPLLLKTWPVEAEVLEYVYPSISEITIAIDDTIKSLCPAIEETIAVTPEAEEANRLWLLDVLDDADEVLCAPDASSDDDSSCVQDDGDAPANPNLTAETSDATVRNALPAVRLVVQNFPTRRARLNANVVPQLLALLQRTDTRIQRETAQILGSMGNSLTAAHRATARTRLAELSRTTQDPTVRAAADAALRLIPE